MSPSGDHLRNEISALLRIAGQIMPTPKYNALVSELSERLEASENVADAMAVVRQARAMALAMTPAGRH